MSGWTRFDLADSTVARYRTGTVTEYQRNAGQGSGPLFTIGTGWVVHLVQYGRTVAIRVRRKGPVGTGGDVATFSTDMVPLSAAADLAAEILHGLAER